VGVPLKAEARTTKPPSQEKNGRDTDKAQRNPLLPIHGPEDTPKTLARNKGIPPCSIGIPADQWSGSTTTPETSMAPGLAVSDLLITCPPH